MHPYDTAIDPRGGAFPRRLELPGLFVEYLFEQAQRVLRSQQLISDRQNGLIRKAYRANMDRAAGSGTLDSLAAHMAMFGREVVFRDESEF